MRAAGAMSSSSDIGLEDKTNIQIILQLYTDNNLPTP